MAQGKDVANLGKESILTEVECEYCTNPAQYQTRTRLSGVLGRLEDTCNFHHVTKQDNKYGGDNARHCGCSGETGINGVPEVKKKFSGLYGTQSHQPHHQSGERT